MRNLFRLFLFLPIVPLALATTASATSLAEAKKGVATAYAAIDSSNGTVLAFGGKRATAATATCGAGGCQLTVTGKFPSDVAADKLIVNTTANASNNVVTSAVVSAASPTSIVVDVSRWKSDDGSLPLPLPVVSVTIFVGR